MKKTLISILLTLCCSINVYAYDYEIKSVTITKNDVEYNNIPEKLAFDYSINIQIDALVDMPMSGKIIVAQYDKDNILCHCDIIPCKYDNFIFQPIVKKNDDYSIIVKDYSDFIIAGGGGNSGSNTGGSSTVVIGSPKKHIHKIKAFIWDDMIFQNPLSKTSIII